MGKKSLKRKLNKSGKAVEQIKDVNTSENEVKSFVYILCSVLVFIGVGYFILTLTMKEEEVIDNTPTIQERMQSDKILGQDVLGQQPGEYVVFYVNGDEGLDQLDRYYDAFVTGRTQLPVYVVDMQESVNATYLVDDTEVVEKYGDFAPEVIEYNKDPEKLDEIEVYNFPTVIHVKDASISGYYEGDMIFDVLGLNEQNAG